MRLFGYEIRKIIQSRNYLLIFFAFLVINGCLLYVGGQKNEMYTAEAYRNLHEDIAGLSEEKAIEELTKQIHLAGFCIEMQMGGDAQELLENFGNAGKDILAAYEKGECLKYTTNPYTEQQLLQRVLNEYKHCQGYQEYLDGIQTAAKHMEKLAALQGVSGYNFRNVKKTAKVFSGRTADGVRPGPALGIENAANPDATDYLIILFLFLVVMALLMREKEQQRLLLTRTTMNGRTRLGTEKLLAGFAIGGMTVVCFYGTNLFLCGWMYGLGDLTRKIQSLEMYRSCPFQGTVLEYYVLLVLGKVLVCCLFVSIFYLAAVCCQTSIGMYISMVAVVGAEVLLYFFSRGSAFLFNLRKLNLITFLKTNSVLSVYQNLNMWGKPVNLQVLFWCMVFGGTILLSGISVIVFARQKGVASVSSRWRWLQRFMHLPMHKNLFVHECYKIFWQGKVAVVLVLFAVAVWYYYKPIEQHFAGTEERYYHYYMTKYEGAYTSEKRQDIENAISSLDEQEMEILLNPSEDALANEMRLQSITVKRTALYQVLERAEYLSKTENGDFVYDEGYRLLIGHALAEKKDYTLALQMVLVMIICLVGVYGIEYETGMVGLVASYARGRRELACRKYLIAILIATIIYGLTYAPYFFNVLHAYGTKMIDTPAYSLPELARFSISLRWYLILVCAIRYVGCLLASSFVLWVTRRVKRISVAIALCTAVLIMPILFALLGVWGSVFFLWNPFWKAKLWK